MNNNYAISFEFINKARNRLTTEEFINLAENRYSNQIKSIVDTAIETGTRVIRLAGPSGSGKTTTAKKIVQRLRDLNIPAYYMSMDNWYKTIKPDSLPLNEDGEPDYESPELLDIEDFKSDVHRILMGEKVNLREFDFTTRVSRESEHTIQCEANGILVIEGLHAINPMFDILEKTLKVYVEPSDVEFDDGSRLTSSNIRLCRRIHRDMVDRGMSEEATVAKCRSVDKGQAKYIEPYTNSSSILMVDTLMFYELYIHKNSLPDFPLIKRVPASKLTSEIIPDTSVLKEFYK